MKKEASRYLRTPDEYEKIILIFLLMIRLENVSKQFEKKNALRDLSLEISAGEVFGFLGPNGAGKTTTMKMILGFLRPSQGRIFLLGKPAGSPEAQEKIGFLPETSHFYRHLSGWEFLCFIGALFGLSPAEQKKRAERLLLAVGLAPESWHCRIQTYSKGMQQRLGMAQALINDPEVIFLDEPMSGLDPLGRREIKDLIISLKKQGKTIFFNSHILSDAETLCDRVGILHLGKMLYEGPLKNLVPPEKTLEDVFVETILAASPKDQKNTDVEQRGHFWQRTFSSFFSS